ncbi:hypothetical protein J3B02_004987 [Coemansia erecta]|nr:hypothetical protein J3B02_004987 [Coemansia erecta]
MSGADPNSRFVSEADIQEARKQREAAWQKAYESGQQPPPEADPTYDPRTLYERLQEQRRRKEEALAESRRHANLIRKLDADESEFLETIEDQEHEKLVDQQRAELAALAAFKEQIAEKQQSKGMKRKLAVSGLSGAEGRSQKSILSRIGSVVTVRAAERVNPVEDRTERGGGGNHDSRGLAETGDDVVVVDDKSVSEDTALGGFLAAYQSASDSSSDSDKDSDKDNDGEEKEMGLEAKASQS